MRNVRSRGRRKRLGRYDNRCKCKCKCKYECKDRRQRDGEIAKAGGVTGNTGVHQYVT